MKKLAFCLFALLAFVQQGFALNPSKEYKQTPDKYNIKYEEKTAKTKDGATLNVWFFPSTVKTSKTVLFAHNGEGNMADYIQKIHAFISLGVNVVSFDYRGFGKSSDFKIDNNMYIYPEFLEDMSAMINFCRANYVGTTYIYGFGIGGSLALGVGWHRPEITKIIADTPYLTLEGLERKFAGMEQKMEVPFAGYEKKYEPFYAVENPNGKILTNVMLIIADKEKLMTLDEMKKLQAKNKKIISEIFIIKNSDGTDNFLVDKTFYMSKITPFIKN